MTLPFSDQGVTGAGVDLELTLDLSPERFWALASDVTRIGEWSPECVHAGWLGTDREPRVGARFEARNQYRNGDTSRVVCQVIEAERPHRFGWVVLDDANDPARPFATWRYELLPTGSPDRTVVRHGFEHGPGDSGLRAAVLKYPERTQEILDGRLAELRRHMTRTIEAMVRSTTE